MDIRILELIEGAKLAEGLTVVIDVFRAFSLECYLFARGAKEILPVGDINEAFALKREDENRVLIGERHGKKCEGCDFGNSPSQTAGFDFTGRTVVHTTSGMFRAAAYSARSPAAPRCEKSIMTSASALQSQRLTQIPSPPAGSTRAQSAAPEPALFM